MRAATYKDSTIYRRLIRQAKPYWAHVVGYGTLEFLSSPLTLLVPVPMQIVVDNVLGSHPLPRWLDRIVPDWVAASPARLLAFAVGMLIVLRVADLAHSLVVSLVRMYTAERLVMDFRARLFLHAQRVSLGYHDAKGAIDATQRIQHDAPAIQYIIIDGIIPFLRAAIMIASMLYVMMRLDWSLALVALAVSPVFLFSSQLFRRRLRSESREVKAVDSETVSVIQEVLAGLRVVKAFGQEQREHGRYVGAAGNSLRAKARLMVTESKFSVVIGLTTTLGTAAVIYVGARHIQAGVLTLGTLLLMMQYLSQFYVPLKTIGRKVASLQSHFASIERAFELLDASQDVEQRPDARPLGRAAGRVTFEGVSFAYDERRTVLHDFSFDVEPGTRVGVAGTTGAGKTTLMNLLTRFYDPTAGRILLDGVDARDVRLEDYRGQFAIVLQEPLLFSCSIAENIAYSRPDATEAEIVAAARAANAHEFITALPDGYRTKVGERGMRLSGGERQRIALARAFLRDAPILILDEPTSAVDVRTESLIVEAMERLMSGRTTFMIAHRLSTLRHCDRLLRVEEGRLLAPADDVTATLTEMQAAGAVGARG